MAKNTKNYKRLNKREVYKLKNWSSYNRSLKNRGRITFWFSDEVKTGWQYNGTQLAGGKVVYSDSCIEFCLIMKHLFSLAYRQTEGFIEDIFELAGIDLEVPSYTQIQRRSGKLEVDIRVRKERKQNLNVVLDSTGLKVYGEGEWKMRKHGKTKRRTWRKLHMGSDGADLEILSVVLTNNDVADHQAGIELMDSITESVEKVAGDGAYDKVGFRRCLEEGVVQLIPPQENAVLSSKWGGPILEQRDTSIKRIKEIGREDWKKECGYHIRSLSEVNMYRYKKIFGASMNARKNKYEQAEVKIKCKILNAFIGMGMPISYKVS